MADLVFELGCEELPASAVKRACEQLQSGVEDRLRDAGLAFDSSRWMGTPRRLILGVEGLPDRQPDTQKRQRGPALKSAYNDDGAPTGALLGFCKGQGIEPADLEKEGDYVWVTKKIEGRPTADLLAEIIPASVRALTFDKTMRWGSSRMRFSRPLRWMLAALDGKLVDFEIEGVRSGLESRGHRFRRPEAFAAGSWDELVSGLRVRFVEPDPAVRESRIREQAEAVSQGKAQLSPELIEENVYLTEWPECLLGDFPPSYLDLPRSVLVTAMAKHEKMFPVESETGELLNQFVWVRNSGEEAAVRAGNQWVLNARFNDAKFFYDEDSRLRLDDFLEKTSLMTFQEKLGTVRQRADRLSELTAVLAIETGASEDEVAWAREAGLYAKADLSTGLVGELASLQGIVGGDYARRENRAEPVCHAIATQYDLGRNPSPDSPESRTGLRLLMADQMDKLVGFLGIGQLPSGSSDPFGLRRAGTLLIEAAWLWPGFGSYQTALQRAADLYQSQEFALDREQVFASAALIFEQRLEALLAPRRYDVIAAALVPGAALEPRRVRVCADALAAIADDGALVSALSRPLNILAAAEKKSITPDADASVQALSEEVERKLDAAAAAAHATIIAGLQNEESSSLVNGLASLAEPINAFFDSVMVMVEDESVRDARLGLLARVRNVIRQVGDVAKLVPDSQP